MNLAMVYRINFGSGRLEEQENSINTWLAKRGLKLDSDPDNREKR